MSKLKNNLLIISSVVVSISPAMITISCGNSAQNNTITREALNKEATNLEKNNFFYNNNPFNIGLTAFTYNDVSKISGSSMSIGTVIIASKVEAKETKLKITYTLKNGDVFSSKQIFEYSGFISKTQEQKQIEIEADVVKSAITSELTKITDEMFRGRGNKLPSEATKILIEGLPGFPKTKNDVQFEYISSVPNNITGTLLITIKASKKGQSFNKDVTILGFKTTAQVKNQKRKEQLAIEKQIKEKQEKIITIKLDISAEIKKINDNTIMGNKEKLPSEATRILIEGLPGFPKTKNDVQFEYISSVPNNITGTLLITIKASKKGQSFNKDITVFGFKTIAQSNKNDVVEELAKINNETIKSHQSKLPSEMSKILVEELPGFPKTTNGIKFESTLKKYDDNERTLTIVLKATKGEISVSKQILIKEFSTITQALFWKIKYDRFNFNGDNTKLPSDITKKIARLVSSFKIAKLFKETFSWYPFEDRNLDLYLGNSRLIRSNDFEGTLEVPLILYRNKKGQRETTTLTIGGFKTWNESLEALHDVWQKLSPINDSTISGDGSKHVSLMTFESIKSLSGFPKSSNGVSIILDNFRFVVKKRRWTDLDILEEIRFPYTSAGGLEAHITATKYGEKLSKKVIIWGFKTPELISIDTELAKINNKTISGDRSKLPTEMAVGFVSSLSGFPRYSSNNVNLHLTYQKISGPLTRHYKIESFNDEEGWIEILLVATKNQVRKVKLVRINGFKTSSESLINKSNIEIELKKLNDKTFKGDNTKLPPEVTTQLVKELTKFPKNINGVKIDFTIKSFNDREGWIEILLVATKQGDKKEKTIKIKGFKKA